MTFDISDGSILLFVVARRFALPRERFDEILEQCIDPRAALICRLMLGDTIPNPSADCVKVIMDLLKNDN